MARKKKNEAAVDPAASGVAQGAASVSDTPTDAEASSDTAETKEPEEQEGAGQGDEQGGSEQVSPTPEVPADPVQPPTGEDGSSANSDDLGPEEVAPQEPSYPCQVQVTNNTRMPVEVPASGLALGPAPASTVITVQDQGSFTALLNDLDALRELNGFGEDAFTIAPAESGE